MMKLRLNALTAALLLGLTIGSVSCSKDKIEIDPIEEIEDSAQEVVFEDVELTAFIKEELKLAANATITRGDLTKLTTLNIRGALTSVTSLKGLEYATELTVLDFGANPVSDLTPIKDLKKITYLRMNESAVVDLTPISAYTTLTYFNANRASPGITSIAALSNNADLQQLILRGNPIGNEGMTALSNFKKIYRLNARGTGFTDLSIIAGLMADGAFLKTTPGATEAGEDAEIDLRDNGIESWDAILPYIMDGTSVSVNPAPTMDDNNTPVVFSDSNLEEFIKLELEVSSGPVTRGALKALTSLNIRGALTNVTSLVGLEHATELTVLDFGGNPVTDLTPIKDLRKITYLRMNETPVEDLSPISEYTTLTYFNSNQASPGLKDISPLAKNVNIQEMILRGNPLGNELFETVKNFTKLHRLNLRSTGITNVTVLGELMSKGALLKTTEGYVEGDSELDLRGNTISEYTPIQSYIDGGTAVNVSK